MRVHRYLTHAVVLAVAVAISSYATMDRNFPSALTSRLGAVNAEAVVVSVLMSDIRGYTGLAERADPSALAGQLNVHRAEMSRAIASGASEGTGFL